MKKNAVLKSLRINYFVTFVALLVLLFSFEFGLIEKDVLMNVVPSSVLYMIQVIAIMLTVILIPLAIKGFTKSMEKARGLSEDAFLKVYCKKNIQRIFLLFVVLVVNIFVYYAFGYNGSLYCILLGFGSMIYSFPTKMVLEQFLCDKEK